ncbi:hypothetical protein HgNV_049 [Homarus gammarus nudivirus]|uniref:Uncharacterized protein n=1 Tax=Homarus gammarus nudivirus TaxID=2509616 RepID=A0A411HB94_9VIRU|nr:hypothetical protein KM727_gp49 [Homarus gammarus nudivirus]QBB28654.1 hypothetical protein HgNV_049 [Homarus gammarus nudivirus]
MNKYTDDTNVLRSHYYILKTQKSEYSIPIYIKNAKCYIHKESRNFDTDKFTHVNFLSLFRVLAFSYMRFKCNNINEILNTSKQHLHKKVERSVVEKSGCCVLTADGTVQVDKAIAYQHMITGGGDKELAQLIALNAWAHDKPDIDYIKPDQTNTLLFNYDTPQVELYHFTRYVNNIFKSNISTLLQNPIILVCEDINIKYTMFKIFNNINILACDLFPSVYDFLVAQSILDYIDNV